MMDDAETRRIFNVRKGVTSPSARGEKHRNRAESQQGKNGQKLQKKGLPTKTEPWHKAKGWARHTLRGEGGGTQEGTLRSHSKRELGSICHFPPKEEREVQPPRKPKFEKKEKKKNRRETCERGGKG